MATQKIKKSGGNRKHGRNTDKCKGYRSRKVRERNKIKRILRSNGIDAAQAYAKKHSIPLPKIRSEKGTK